MALTDLERALQDLALAMRKVDEMMVVANRAARASERAVAIAERLKVQRDALLDQLDVEVQIVGHENWSPAVRFALEDYGTRQIPVWVVLFRNEGGGPPQRLLLPSVSIAAVRRRTSHKS